MVLYATTQWVAIIVTASQVTLVRNVKLTLMTANQIPVVMVACVGMALTRSPVHVCLVFVGDAVNRILMSVKVTLAKMGPTVLTVSTVTPAPAHLALVA